MLALGLNMREFAPFGVVAIHRTIVIARLVGGNIVSAWWSPPAWSVSGMAGSALHFVALDFGTLASFVDG